jgi:hypothetical protein
MQQHDNANVDDDNDDTNQRKNIPANHDWFVPLDHTEHGKRIAVENEISNESTILSAGIPVTTTTTSTGHGGDGYCWNVKKSSKVITLI